jgi:hypothetical protein
MTGASLPPFEPYGLARAAGNAVRENEDLHFPSWRKGGRVNDLKPQENFTPHTMEISLQLDKKLKNSYPW